MLEELRVGASRTKEPGGARGRKAGAGTDRKTDRPAARSLQGYCKRSGDAPEGRELQPGPFLSVLRWGSCHAGEPPPACSAAGGHWRGPPEPPAPAAPCLEPLPAHFAYFFFKQLVTFCSYRSIYYCVHPLSINTSAYVSCAPPRGCCPAGTPVSRPGPPPPVVVLIFLPQLCLRDPRLPPSAPGTKSSLLFFYKKQSPEAGAGSALPPIS